MPSNPYKRRKTSQMEDSGNTYEAAQLRPSMKVEPGLPIDDSPCSSRSTSPGAFPIKQTLSIGKVLPGHSSANGHRGTTIFGPWSNLHKSSAMPRKEVDWPGNHRGKTSNVDTRGSSSLTELSMWDISESEMHTTDIEEESSEGESVGSDFSPGIDRQESVKSEEVSSGSDYLHREKSNNTSNGRGTVQDQNYISSAEPAEPATNGHDPTEQNTPQNRLSHNDDNRVRDEPVAIPANGVTGQNIETTVRGEPRKRAAAKSHMSTRDISRSWKTASPADKMLMKMKRKGCSWVEIRTAWEELTGERPAPSTLPNRYSRIKDHMTRLEPGDGKRLLDAAAEVEAEYQRSKWQLIAESMQRAGAAKYSKAFIQKKYTELSNGNRTVESDRSSVSTDEQEPGGRSDDEYGDLCGRS